jgi:hypothetical protein
MIIHESPKDFMRDDIFNDFPFLVSHVHKFHIFVAVFLISMSHVHASNLAVVGELGRYPLYIDKQKYGIYEHETPKTENH